MTDKEKVVALELQVERLRSALRFAASLEIAAVLPENNRRVVEEATKALSLPCPSSEAKALLELGDSSITEEVERKKLVNSCNPDSSEYNKAINVRKSALSKLIEIRRTK